MDPRHGNAYAGRLHPITQAAQATALQQVSQPTGDTPTMEPAMEMAHFQNHIIAATLALAKKREYEHFTFVVRNAGQFFARPNVIVDQIHNSSSTINTRIRLTDYASGANGEIKIDGNFGTNGFNGPIGAFFPTGYYVQFFNSTGQITICGRYYV